MRIRVDCYAGYRAEEIPRRLHFGEQVVRVQRLLDRWLAPDHRYFKILGDDNAVYIIRHDTQNWRWELTFYRSADPPHDAHAPPPENLS